MKCLYIKQICGETYQIKCLYIKCIGGETFQMKYLYIKQICGETYQIWEVLMWFDSEAAARVSGAAETVDYFG